MAITLDRWFSEAGFLASQQKADSSTMADGSALAAAGIAGKPGECVKVVIRCRPKSKRWARKDCDDGHEACMRRAAKARGLRRRQWEGLHI